VEIPSQRLYHLVGFFAIGLVSRVYHHAPYKAKCVGNYVPLTAINLFIAIYACFLSYKRSDFNRLRINAKHTWRFFLAQPLPPFSIQRPIELLECAILAPFPKVIINQGPFRISIYRQIAPLAAQAQVPQNRIYYFTKRMLALPLHIEERFYNFPLRV